MERRFFLALAMLLFSPLLKATTPRKPTPTQTEGPFYPVVAIPLREELITQPDRVKGKPLTLYGRVVDTSGNPLSGIKVEIWQCDSQGIYAHPRQVNHDQFDHAFAGFGATQTRADGRYQFHTLHPVPYGSRPPHIHVKLWRGKQELLTTQLYLQGNTGNEWWGGSEREHLQFLPRETGNTISGEFTFVLA